MTRLTHSLQSLICCKWRVNPLLTALCSSLLGALPGQGCAFRAVVLSLAHLEPDKANLAAVLNNFPRPKLLHAHRRIPEAAAQRGHPLGQARGRKSLGRQHAPSACLMPQSSNGRPPACLMSQSSNGRPPTCLMPQSSNGRPPACLPPQSSNGRPPACLMPQSSNGRPPACLMPQSSNGRPPACLMPQSSNGRLPARQKSLLAPVLSWILHVGLRCPNAPGPGLCRSHRQSCRLHPH